MRDKQQRQQRQQRQQHPFPKRIATAHLAQLGFDEDNDDRLATTTTTTTTTSDLWKELLQQRTKARITTEEKHAVYYFQSNDNEITMPPKRLRGRSMRASAPAIVARSYVKRSIEDESGEFTYVEESEYYDEILEDETFVEEETSLYDEETIQEEPASEELSVLQEEEVEVVVEGVPENDGNEQKTEEVSALTDDKAAASGAIPDEPSPTSRFEAGRRRLPDSVQKIDLPSAHDARRRGDFRSSCLATSKLSSNTLAHLANQGYTRGLIDALSENKEAFPMAIWVVDNSGSMRDQDGHRLIKHPTKMAFQMVPCTRWAEMQHTVDYHAQLAAKLQSPVVFRLLNDPGRAAGPQQFSVAKTNVNEENIKQDLKLAKKTMQKTQPRGVTPLVDHIRAIHDNIVELEPKLIKDGTQVVVVLATDGTPTDDTGFSNEQVQKDFIDAMRSLENLPVWVVVRLCTDEEEVVTFWNGLDDQLELSLDVLDDFVSEAEEVHKCNNWLNYGLPLHRIREMGFHSTLMDLLDERKLLHDELPEFCRLLFGDDAMEDMPDPQVDWDGFCGLVKVILEDEDPTWDPVTKQMGPWIYMDRLQEEYGSAGFGWDL